MDIKLIALDLDGTLLSDDKSISKVNIESIKKCLDRDIKIVISTGRPIQGVKKYKELDVIKDMMINYNGAMVFDNYTNKILYEKTLLDTDARKVYDLVKKVDTTVCIWSDNKLYSNKINEWSNKYKGYSNQEVHLINDINEIKTKITKIVFFDNKDKIDSYLKMLDKISFNEIKYVKTTSELLEVFNSSVSKASALDYILKAYKIDKENTMAIGDGENDLEILNYVNLAIVMDNALDVVKSSGDFITLSNNDNGVALAIDKFVLGGN